RPVERHEVWPGLFELKAHGQWIDDLDLLDASLEFLGARPLVALVAELHVLGRDGVAIVEGETAAELELVGPSIGALAPRLRKARAHLLARVRTDESVVNGVEQSEGRDLWRRRGGVEPARSDGDVPGHHGLARRRSGECRGRGPGDAGGEEQ